MFILELVSRAVAESRNVDPSVPYAQGPRRDWRSDEDGEGEVSERKRDIPPSSESSPDLPPGRGSEKREVPPGTSARWRIIG